MTRTTVLFLCPDNSLLGPLAEAYLNHRAGSLIRAFSAGTIPAERLNCYVSDLLSSDGLDAKSLAPKPVDIFWFPHAVIPDRVIYLAEMKPVSPPVTWKSTTSSHWWSIAREPLSTDRFETCARYYRQIRKSIDDLFEPPAKPLQLSKS